jgi:hypothetical protein
MMIVSIRCVVTNCIRISVWHYYFIHVPHQPTVRSMHLIASTRIVDLILVPWVYHAHRLVIVMLLKILSVIQVYFNVEVSMAEYANMIGNVYLLHIVPTISV